MNVQVVSFHCVLKNKMGHVLSTSFNQDVLTSSMAHNAPLGALSESLQNIRSGEKRRILIPAAKAYGFYDPRKVLRLPLEELNSPPKMGEKVQLASSDIPYRVVEINEDMVILEGNHPLAGQDLVFEVEATQARPATAEEVSHQLSFNTDLLLH